MENEHNFRTNEIKDNFSKQRKILAKKLLDLSARNPLIRTNFRSARTGTSTKLRLVNASLEQIFTGLQGEKPIGFESINKPNSYPEDEETPEFRANLEALRQDDIEYKTNLERLGDDASERDIDKLERKLRDKLRETMGMPKVDTVIPSIEEQALNQGLNPSYELPLFDFDNRERVRGVSYFQTLKYPDDLERSLRQIHSQARLRESETGLNFLSIALGFLEWYAADTADKPFLSPIIISTVRIEKNKEGEESNFTITQEADPALNLCLREKLLSDHGIALPDFDPEGSIEKYLEIIKELVEGQKNWRVHRYALIGFYSFAKLVMHKDLLEDEWDEEAGTHGILSELFGVSGGGPASFGEEYDVDQHELRSICPTLPLPADASQISAVIDALKGENLALEGPPGTGKSQTIANLIGALAAKGKTVLFISEKKAALDVVKARLDKAGYGEICLELHSAKTKKSEIAKVLVNQYSRYRTYHNYFSGQIPQLDQLFSAIDGLNKRSKTINELKKDSSFTLFQKIGKYLTTERNATEFNEIPTDCKFDRPFTDKDERIRLGIKILEEIKLYLSNIRTTQNIRQHPWINLYKFLTEEQCSNAELEIPEFLLLLTKIKNDLQNPAYPGPEELGWSIEEVLSCFHSMDVADLTAPKSHLIKIISNTFGKKQAEEYLDAVNKSRILEDNILDVYGIRRDSLADINYETYRETARVIGAKGWGNLNREKLAGVRNELDKKLSDINDCKSLLFEAQKLLGLDKFSGSANELFSLTQIVNSAEILVKESLGAGYSLEILSEPGALKKIRSADNKFKRLRTLKSDLKVIFDLKLTFPPEKILGIAKVFTETGWFWWLNKNARMAARKIQEISYGKSFLNPNKTIINLRNLAEFLEELNSVLNDESLKTFAGDYWDGLETDFIAIEKASEAATKAKESVPASDLGKKALNVLLGKDRNRVHQFAELAKNINFKKLITVYEFLESEESSSLLNLYELEDSVKNKLVSVSKIQEQMAAIPFPIEMEFQQLNKFLDQVRENMELKAQKSKWFDLCENEKVSSEEASDPKLIDAFLAYAKCVEILKINPSRRNYLLTIDGPSSFNSLRDYFLSQIKIITKIESFVSDYQLAFAEHLKDFKILELSKLIIKFQDLANSAIDIPNVKNYSEKVGTFERNFGPDSIKAFEVVPKLFDLIPETLDHLWFRSELYSELSSTNVLSVGYVQETLKSLKKLDDESRISFVQILLSRIRKNEVLSGNPGPSVKDKTQFKLLEHQANLQRKHVEIRELMTRAGKSILAIRPCFMMSPMSVATYLPSENMEFDVVIMDEASQVKVEDALGAILRGKQLVVVGDENQLPPTSFFWLGGNQNEIADDSEEIDETDGFGSILEFARPRVKRNRTLLWHYRSKHHSLIAYSNREFYRNNLILPPSPYTTTSFDDLGIKHIYVKDHVYAGRKNSAEANVVIGQVIEHLNKRFDKSLGLVSINHEQRILLDDLLQELENANPHFRRFLEYHEKKGEPFFIKNLENVQGDERDYIIISTVYGNDSEGNFFQRFGPITGQSGHRRLNVLFTRSRYSTILVTSIVPEKITSSGRGMKVLKEYLQYASTGRLPAIINDRESRPPANEFEEMVMEVLTNEGFECIPQFGVSGFFIDIAIKDPSNPDKILGGVECDGASYHSIRSARDRDRLREEILVSLGWNIYRIWSTDWFHDRKRQEVQLLEAVRSWMSLTKKKEASTVSEIIHQTVNEPISKYDPKQNSKPDISIMSSSLKLTDPNHNLSPSTLSNQKIVFNIYLKNLVREKKELNNLYKADKPGPEQNELNSEIFKILIKETPIHLDLLCERLGEVYGFAKTGDTIKGIINIVLKMMVKERKIRLLENGDVIVVASNSPIVPRGKTKTLDIRNVEHIPVIEIKYGILKVLESNGAMNIKALVNYVGSAFGYERIGSNVEKRLSLGISELLADDKIIIKDDKITFKV